MLEKEEDKGSSGNQHRFLSMRKKTWPQVAQVRKGREGHTDGERRPWELQDSGDVSRTRLLPLRFWAWCWLCSPALSPMWL